MALLPSGLPEDVGDDEDLARFLTQSSHFTAMAAKPAAFMPAPRINETSVSRHGREPLDTLWRLGQTAAGERKLYGAAFVNADTVRTIHLEVVASEPPPRHAAIRGWPVAASDPREMKAMQLDPAIALAAAAGSPLRR